ncbi:MAG: acetyl-CoA hydrolase/transferase family protein [Bacteroidales bacterium]|nr:acetyl-CoA hydrolase/transferase family protein [Bacteroidales bacterium]
MTNINYITADEAVSLVRAGDHIHWPCVSCAPEHLIKALVHRADNELDRGSNSSNALRDVTISHFYTEGYADYVLPKYRGIFHLDAFFVGGNVRQATDEGRADHIPCSLSETPRMIASGAVGCDVVFLMVSLPDDEGFVSLGTSVDYMPEAIAMARCVIAQVNSYVPYTYGDSRIHVSKITAFVRHDAPLLPAAPLPLSETDMVIGRHCAALIPDGATLQIGIGNIPTAVLSQLHDHKNLGVHSEMFSDSVIPLVEEGVINGSCKRTDPGKMVAMFLKGSQRLYDFVDHNDSVLMRDVGYTNNPAVIASNPRVVALNSAIQIDLTGQVCSDSIGSRIFSGSGGQLDFILGATYSPGGIPIIAMPSITAKGVSKIVPTLTPGAGVVTPRTLVQWVVTEQGAVNLYGLSLRQRAKALISIAHPSVRDMLSAEL